MKLFILGVVLFAVYTTTLAEGLRNAVQSQITRVEQIGHDAELGFNLYR